MTTTERVRQYLEASGRASAEQIRDGLNLSSDNLHAIIQELVERNEVRREGKGVYVWLGRIHTPGEAEKRIWQAMRINPTFSVREIAMQGGCSEDYARKRLWSYVAAGYAQRVGRRNTGASSVKLYRLTAAGQRRLSPPDCVRPDLDPMIKAAVELNRLICTSRVRISLTDRAEAIRLCAELQLNLEILQQEEFENAE